MNSLIDWLSAYCNKNGITIDFQTKFPTCSLVEKRFILINTNQTKKDEYPFAIAHEIGHINSEDAGVYYFASAHNSYSSEHQADVFAVKLIYDYCKENDIQFDNAQLFTDQMGIPCKLVDDAGKILGSDMK